MPPEAVILDIDDGSSARACFFSASPLRGACWPSGLRELSESKSVVPAGGNRRKD
jgi:hypothetical protein